MNGALRSSKDARDYTLADCLELDTSVSVPDKYLGMWLPDIRNQGETDSCTAYALAR